MKIPFINHLTFNSFSPNLNLILNFGLEWAGFPALAFYMHTILKQMKIPLDEYWVAVGLAGYRSLLTLGLSFVLYKVRRRPVYLLAGSLVCLATASLSAYNWLLPHLAQVWSFKSSFSDNIATAGHKGQY